MISTIEESAMGTVVSIGNTLSIYSVPALRDELILNIEKHEMLKLSLSEVEACDAAGLQLLFSARKTADTMGKTVTICNPSSAVIRAFESIGSDIQEMMNEYN
jgi:anti-anti-sigma factor